MSNRRSSRLLSLLVLLALLSQAVARQAPQPSTEIKQAAALAGAVLVSGRSMDYVKGLTDGFGGRLSGSPAYERSAEWAAEQFRAAGIKDVRLEPFTIDNGWQRGEARGRVVAPVERALNVASLGWSASTPPGGVRGEVVWVGDVSPEFFRKRGGELKGRVAMLDVQSIFARGVWQGFGQLVNSHQRFKDAGALAVVFPDSEANNVLNAFSPSWGARATPLPYAQIGMEDAKLIRRLSEAPAAKPVVVELQFDNKVSGRTTTHNVVAEIRGRERPDEWVIIGAHLDSWDYGTGAHDNATGCAMVLEAARAIASLPQPPRRSIRFALWGGEEQGLLGSAAYVAAHSAELKDCVAALNTDNGAGHPRGWKVQGREDVSEAMGPISEALLAGLAGGGLSPELTFDTDHGHFMLAGVPALDLWVEMEGYQKVHHKSSDTLDKVEAHDLAAGAAIVAVTAYAVAERETRLAPHDARGAVGERLKKAGLDEFLKAIGVWK
ncbi:MAG TPA: M20/M25/M40 family metallo-hydrolase [Pyrinomonadaceae bacterium]